MNASTILLLLVLPFCLLAKQKHKHRQQMPQIDLFTDLTAYYTLNQRADLGFFLHDEIGHAHLTPHNLSFTEDGVSDGAIVFTGNDGYASFTPNSVATDAASLAAKAAVRMGVGQSYSIICWIKFQSLAGGISGGAKFIVTKLDAVGTAIEYGIVWSANTELLQFRHGSGGGNADVVEATIHGPMTVDRWYHVYAWHDAENHKIGISINLGTADIIDTTELGGVGSPEPTFTLGLSSDGAGGDFRGQIDELAIYKRVALDAAIVHYNNGEGLPFEDWDAPDTCKKITCCDP